MNRPNILVSLSDQLRRHALRPYEDPNVATPACDAIAQGGTAFRNACSTYPVCVPFRVTLMTGHYAHSRATPLEDPSVRITFALGYPAWFSPCRTTSAHTHNTCDWPVNPLSSAVSLNSTPRSLSDLGDCSEHGGRASTEFPDFEAHWGALEREMG
jgi:hypothetical protein